MSTNDSIAFYDCSKGAARKAYEAQQRLLASAEVKEPYQLGPWDKLVWWGLQGIIQDRPASFSVAKEVLHG